uniref:Mitochondrial carrier protein n=1 Tax=Solanum tuberosum TaxID=4113 RepID=M1AGD7_SOLTU
MVLKELITHRIQSGAKGRSWQVLMRILDKDGILRLRKTKRERVEPFQSVCCGALAGAISASLAMLLDVVKTWLMTQFDSEPANKVDVSMVTGILATVRQILKGERRNKKNSQLASYVVLHLTFRGQFGRRGRNIFSAGHLAYYKLPWGIPDIAFSVIGSALFSACAYYNFILMLSFE